MKSSVEVGNDRSGVIVFRSRGRVRPQGSRRTARIVRDQAIRQVVQHRRVSTGDSVVAEEADAGLSAGFQRDVGILSNPSVCCSPTQQRFSTTRLVSEWSAGGEQLSAEPILQDPRNRFVRSMARRFGSPSRKEKDRAEPALTSFGEKTGSEPDAMYFRYYLRFADGWSPSDGGKLLSPAPLQSADGAAAD